MGYGVGNYDPRYYVVKNIGNFFKMDESELKKHFGHLSSDLRDNAIKYISECKQYWEATRPYPGSKVEPQMAIPFEYNHPITEDDLNYVLTYNICPNQSDILKQSLLIKNRNLYNYFLLFGDIKPAKSKKLSEESEIFRHLVRSSNCPAGEAIGGKAALSFGRPMT